MIGTRIELAVDRHGLDLPEAGTILVVGVSATDAPWGLARDRTLAVHPLRHEHDAWTGAGWQARPDLPEPGRFAAALVALPRARAAARDLIARVAALCDGPVVVDGAKTDGVEAMLRDLRAAGVALMPADGAVAKAHGKLSWFHGPDARLDDWRAPDQHPAPGFVTRPGIFSADAPDPASILLAEALPAALGSHVVDLGAGWGWLSAAVLARTAVKCLDLVEADHTALDCARAAITDPRARFHWADARVWQPEGRPDCVVMNPPFHAGRAADPGIGAAFIAAAARILGPNGMLWLVANRHLPYEAALSAGFAETAEVAGDARYKVICARKPRGRSAARTVLRTRQERSR
jgi:16S rRNA (guanine1207-N2)-methyltransferase